MKQHHILSPALLVLLMSAAPAFAADASGVWEGEVVLPTGQVLPFVARLSQEGAVITGTLDGIGGAPDVSIVDGTIEDDVVTFSGARPINDESVRFNYTARFVDDDTLHFDIVLEDGNGVPLESTTRRSPDSN